MVEHLVYTEAVGGSNPSACTIFRPYNFGCKGFVLSGFFVDLPAWLQFILRSRFRIDPDLPCAGSETTRPVIYRSVALSVRTLVFHVPFWRRTLKSLIGRMLAFRLAILIHSLEDHWMSQTPPKYSAFISYASPDLEKAEAICQNLEGSGFTCWIAPRNVRPGKEYGEEIILGIQNSRCLVLVLSEAANDSTFVRREVERAVSKNKPVFPVRIEDVLPSTGLELFVSTTHWIDAWSPPLERHWEALARELKDQDTIKDLARTAQRGRRKKALPKWLAGAASLLAIVLAVAFTNHLTRQDPPTLDEDPSTPQTVSAIPTPMDGQIPKMPSPEEQRDLADEAMRSFYKGDFLKKVGRPMSSLTAKDFSISVEDPKFRGRYQLRINTSPEIKSAMSNMRIHAAIGDEDFVRAGMFGISGLISYRDIDQETLRADPRVRVKFELSVTGELIGPFEYQLEIPDFNRLKMRQDAQEWNDDRGATIRSGEYALSWSNFWPVVSSIRFGWDSAEALNYQLEFTPLEGQLDEVKEYRRRTPQVKIPCFYGSPHLFIQFELDDGSLTQTRKIPLSWNSYGIAGQIIDTTKSSPNSPQLRVILGTNFYLGSSIHLLPILPAEASKLRYSFDSVGFFVAEKNEIEASSEKRRLFISYLTEDEKEVGPYEFAFDPTETMKLAAKRAFKNDIKDRLAEYQVPSADKRSGLNDREDWFRFNGFPNPKEMQSSGWGYVVKDRTQDEALCWFGVEQVEMGTRPDQLLSKWKRPSVDFIALFSNDHKISGPEQAKFLQWHAAFPSDSPGVFVRYTFYDGEQTEVLRLR